jgi:hypothetical protein
MTSSKFRAAETTDSNVETLNMLKFDIAFHGDVFGFFPFEFQCPVNRQLFRR